MTETKGKPALREKIARLRASFIEQLPGRVAQARSYFERLKADPGDREAATELHRFLHSLKGTGRSFGFHNLGAAAATAEELAGQLLGHADAAPSPYWQDMLGECLDGMAQDVAALCSDAGADAAAGNEMPGFVLAPEAESSERPSGSRVVYLCDDEPLYAQQLATQLACFGYQTVGFADPAALRAAVLARRPDAVIMDINFPEGERIGTDALAALAQETGQTLPAIFLSARNDFAARLAAVQSGGVAYFQKPAPALELVAALDEATREQMAEPYRILIVDDEAEIAAYHGLILQEAGMTTYQISEPARVLDILQEFRPDMVLMDMYMPGCSGRDLARMIRQMPDHIGLPIVYLSSETDRQKQFSAMRVGAEGFLTKPVVPADLVAAVAIRAERMRTLRSLMAKDSLTGLFNHTATTQFLDGAIATARRRGTPVSFAMIDIDHFKAVNDSYGHPVGDQVILALARVLQQRLRNSDIVGRYGGEEFAVILPDIAAAKAGALIDALRDDFARVVFNAGAIEFCCTFSAGIACSTEHKRMELLREAADRALYEAKRSGRNRSVVDQGKQP